MSNGVRGRTRAIEAIISRGSNRDLTASFLPSEIGATYKPLRWQVLSALGPPACTAPATGIPPAGACQVLFPVRPALVKLHTPKLVGCVAAGSKWVFNGPADARDIALTFDDGPWVQTPQFLDVLERYHVPATFFQIGEWISVYGQHDRLEQRMLRDGDMIGDHTWTHPNYTGAGPYERMQVVRAADAIRAATGFYPCLFRAPFGNTSPAQLAQVRSLGMTTIQWDIDPRDWALPGVDAIEDNVLSERPQRSNRGDARRRRPPSGNDRRTADNHHHTAQPRLSLRDNHAAAGISPDLQVERMRATVTRLHLR